MDNIKIIFTDNELTTWVDVDDTMYGLTLDGMLKDCDNNVISADTLSYFGILENLIKIRGVVK